MDAEMKLMFKWLHDSPFKSSFIRSKLDIGGTYYSMLRTEQVPVSKKVRRSIIKFYNQYKDIK